MKKITRLIKFFWHIVESISKIGIYIYNGKFTKKNIKNWFQGNYRLYKQLNNGLEEHIQEQFFYRLTVMSPECKKNKMCPCGCEIIGKQLVDEACENKCYPDFLTNQDWELYKRAYNINMNEVEKEAYKVIQNN